MAPDDDGTGAPPAPAPPPPAPAAAPDPQVPSGSIFDAAGEDDKPAAPAAPGDKPARPEWLAPEFWDDSAGQPRLEALAKSQRDLRARISRGEGKVPEKPDGYALPKVEGLGDGVVPPDDALWSAVRGAAHAAGITQTQLEALAKPYLEFAAKHRPPEADPQANEAAARAAAEQELAKLGPNGKQMVRDMGAWIRGLHAGGALTDGEAMALRSIGTAEGIRALAKLRERGGERAIPVEALQDGAMTQADAQRLLRDGFAKGDQALIDRGRRALADLDRAGMLRPQ